ncbi:MAG TPA: ABC transporter permease [Pyrinomonadaceae bacterium]|jgi:lipopolysaccharide transport system permease protein
MDTTTSNSRANALAPVSAPTAPLLNTEPSSSPQPTPQQQLPEEPLITIKPSTAWVAIDFRDLWAYRELLYLLAWRELKARYKQTIMGVAWVIMQPLMTTIIFTLFFGKLAQVPSDGIPYPVFAYAGLLLWTFFASSVTNSSHSLIANAQLITKIYFPRMIIPGATIGGRLVDFLVAFLILVGMMIYYRVHVTWAILMLPAIIALITLLALGVGMWMAALNVKYRDVGVGLPALIQFWFFASPILYPLSFVPESWRRLYLLNPMVGIIEGFRAAVFGLDFNRPALAYSVVFTLVVLVFSAYAFRRMERSFADLV